MATPHKPGSAHKPSAADFERLFQAAPGLFLVLDPKLNIVAVTDSYLKATKTKREAIIGRHIFEVFPDDPADPSADGVANLRASLERVIKHKRPDAMALQKYSITKPPEEGGGFEERFWSPLNSPLLGDDGELKLIIHRAEDVTALVRANIVSEQQSERARQLESEAERAVGQHEVLPTMLQRAQAAQRSYESLLDSIGGVVWEGEAGQSRNVTNIYVSPLAIQRSGYEREEWKPGFWHAHIHKDDIAVLDRRSEAQPGGNETVLEYRLIAADGQELWMRERVAVVAMEGRNISRGLVLDNTAAKRAEQQLQQSQKMDSIGVLAGGVAHDFNNMLGVIMGHASLVQMNLKPDDPLHARMETIIDAGARSAELTGQLLAFSRQQVLQTKVFSVNSVVEQTEKMLRKIIGADIEVRSDKAVDLGMVRADSGQIQQILMNLAVNARDAMPRGGKLLIATSNVHVDEPYIGTHTVVTPGDYVLLMVSDTGVGMDAATQQRIFEPFFTTKERGKGTGLGLATVYGIVKQSGGYIWVYSEPGHGTMFKIYLPRVYEKATAVQAAAKPADCRGSETVLLAEDQQQYRELISEILRDNGYKVLEAVNGKTALDVGRKSHAGLDLLLTDVIMPEVSGFNVARSLRELTPNMRVIFMSGYTDDSVSRHGIIEEGDGFLQKPFGPGELLTKVRETLGRRA